MKDSIYLIRQNNNKNYYKIGRSKKINHRLKTLQTANISEIIIEAEIPTDDASRLEYELHNKFKQKKIRGEWYRLDKNDIDWIKNLKTKNLTTSLYSVICNGMLNNEKTIIRNDLIGIPIEKFYEAQKYLVGLDNLSKCRASSIETQIQNKKFCLPSKITWIENSNHLTKINSFFRHKYLNEYIHMGCLIEDFENKITFIIITTNENFELEHFSIGVYFKKENNFFIGKNIKMKELNNTDCPIVIKDLTGFCALSAINMCSKVYSMKNIISGLFGTKSYMRFKIDLKQIFSNIASAKKFQKEFCGMTKGYSYGILQNILSQIIILNSPTMHIVKISKLKSSNEYDHRGENILEGNNFHILSNSEKILNHYLNSEITKQHKPIKLHFRRRHLRHLINKITKVKETTAGSREYIYNNKKIEIIK